VPDSQEAYLQIGEVAERTSVTQRTLRFYEEKGLLRPPTRMDGGFRLYSEDDVTRVEHIRQLQNLLGVTLAEIKEMVDAEEVRDDRLFLFREWVREGVYEYEYFVRALVPGTFSHLPAVVSEMYFPENFGRTRGDYFTVTQP